MASLLILFIVLARIGHGAGMNYVYDHVYNLVDNVDFAHTIPQTSSNQAVAVSVSLTIDRVVKLDAENQELVADGYITMKWSDYRLSWEAWVSSDITTIVWPRATDFWTPDVVLVNGQTSEFDTETSAIRFDRRGNASWARRVRMRVPCDVGDGTASNDVNCVIRVMSWAHENSRMTLNGSGMNLNSAESRYDARGGAVTKSTKKYDCCASPFDVINFSFAISRKA